MPYMQKRNYEGRLSPLFAIISISIIVFSIVAVFFMLRAMVVPPVEVPPLSETTDTPQTTTAPDETTNTNDPAETTVPPETTEAPEKPIILPQAEAVGDEYFSSILFIGDSRTQGMQIATGGYGASFYADRGLSIDGMGKTAFVNLTNPDGSKKTVTVLDALRTVPHNGKIYISLGLNAVGWNSTDLFEQLFRADLSALLEICPDNDIVVMSILPIGRNAVVIGCDDNNEVNRRVVAYNQILLDLATEYGLYYLNCYEAFVDAEGYLPLDYSNDDIHLRKDQNILLCEYIRTHPIPSIFER